MAGVVTDERSLARRTFIVPGLRWWIAALLMGVTVINYLDRVCLSVAAPTLKRELSIDEVRFSHVVVAFQLAYLVTQPIAGRIIDWLNVRRGLALSLVWWSLAQMLTALAGGWVGFGALRALLGVGEAANFPTAAKAVAQWFPPKERTVAMGILNAGAGIGGLVAPPLVVFLMLRFDWRFAFVVTGALGVVWVFVWLWLYRAPEEHPLLSHDELAHIRASDAEHPQAADEGGSVWKSVLTRRDFWSLAGARFLSEPAWQLFTYWIPLYLAVERHMSIRDIAYFAWVPFLAGDLGCLVGGLLSPWFMRFGCSVMTARKLSVTACACLMVLAIFIGRAPTPGWAIFFFCTGAFAHQAISSTLLTLPADLFPKRSVATANGLSGAIGIFGGMLFTMIVGRVAMSVGYTPLFVVIAFLDLIGAALLWLFLRGTPSRATAV